MKTNNFNLLIMSKDKAFKDYYFNNCTEILAFKSGIHIFALPLRK